MAVVAVEQTDRAQIRRGQIERGSGFAAIDLGTNNCRLLIGVPTGGAAAAQFRVVDSFSRTVRLGEGLHQHGRLGLHAMERTLSALATISARLERRPVHRVRAVATEACRQAANGREFLARALDETGLRFDLISTREEAELTLESCAPLLQGGGRRALVFDIGGGSTELAWVRLGGAAPELIGYDSLPIGVVTLAERFGKARFTVAGFQAMVDEIRERLLTFEQIHCIGHEMRNGGVRLLGTSGTVTTLAGVALNLDRYRRPLVDGAVISTQAAAEAVALLRRLGPDGLASHPCVGPDRVEFVLPGCAVFEAIRQTWPMADVTVADRGLREGMVLRMMRQANRPLAMHGRRATVRPPQPV